MKSVEKGGCMKIIKEMKKLFSFRLWFRCWFDNIFAAVHFYGVPIFQVVYVFVQ